MTREILKSKIHRVSVTEANLDYVGSITIDLDLMEAADIVEYEKVAVANVTRGSRFETYAIAGERGSGIICINGAAAHLAKVDDIVIVFSYVSLTEEERKNFETHVVLIEEKNKIKEVKHHPSAV